MLVPNQLNALLAVLDELRGARAKTRPELMSRTGLSRAVVGQRIAELLNLGLIVQAGTGASTGGRAPRTLRFHSDLGYILAADLGATSIAIGLADLSGRLIEHQEEASDIASGPRAVLARVQQLLGEVLARHADLAGRLWGIGVGVPGPVEFASGTPVAPPIMPGWDRFPIRDQLREAFGVPVWVDNDVNMMALGEARAGIANGHDITIFVKIGTGIGMGIVVGGHLLRGAQGCAGDAGHIQVTDDPSVICRCGKIGCLEAIAGGDAIGQAAARAAENGRSRFLAEVMDAQGHVTAADVARAASHGDAVAVELISEAGRLVGRMLASAVNLLNPSLVVIGGGFARAGDLLLASIRETIYARSLPLATRELLIQRSVLDMKGGAVGAALMVVDELFAPDMLSAWVEHGRPDGFQLTQGAPGASVASTPTSSTRA